MNKYIKWIVSTVCALTLTTAVFAAAPAPVVKEVNPSLFNAGEVGLTIGSGYDVGKAGEVNGQTLFNDPYTFNLNAGAFWFPWRNVGGEVSVPFYQTKGVSVDEVQAGLLFRFPLSKEKAVFKCFAPYAGVSGVYGWDAVEKWSYLGKLGMEFRTNKKVGFFVEGNYRNNDFSDWGQGAVGINGGLRLVLF